MTGRLLETHLSGTVDPAQYRRTLEALLRRLDTLQGGLDRKVAALLIEMQARIQAALAVAGDGTAALLIISRTGLDETIAALEARWGRLITEAGQESAAIGRAIAAEPLEAAFGGTIALARGATTDLIGILADYAVDLVQGASQALKRRIRGEIAGVLSGASTPVQMARAIGRDLTTRNHFATIGARARTITVTELGRINALAIHQAQQEMDRAAKEEPGLAPLAKRWLNAHLPDARATHLAAEARYAEGGSVGPIPLDEAFTIAGQKAMYPRDPSLTVGESANCHCVSITVIPDTGDAEVASMPDPYADRRIPEPTS